ncbi:MAG: universal stress protein [Flavobacteriales bacterium]|jgi:nucleotide-binding universal stress UspA family protein|nr:universal stress protein [Flavobacteriales bacterium]MBK6551105.1 universal stress protein [Flavobacteriales bacterium]MBK6883637.1 universal stress protein [Flavobacteriales bacterium]MBK7101106.1 universal stress protein [Flavobacteriales bacterium]MBK7111823.1 universal stress protein [Flavobacteriales bacterium]
MSIKTILVPFDFSECATDALRVAAKIARRSGALIDVVHLYEQMTDFHTENQKLRHEIEAKLEAVPKLPFLEGIELRKFMLRQMSLSEMFKNERLQEADLIVMGSHGTSGLRGIVGSNTQRIVRQAPMPVLVVKQHIEDFDLRDIVFASNFSDQDVEKYSDFLPLLDLFDPKVHLLKVNTPRNFERSEDGHRAIDRFLQRHELKTFTATIYNDLSIEEGILNFSKGIDADLIVMATHGRTGFFHVVNGSLTEDIVNHTNFPVLSVKL